MSVHEEMESLADLYVAGGLGADERRGVDQHLAACAACAALLRDAREFASWTKGLIRNDAPPADLEDRVIERFRAAGQTKKRRFIVGKRVLKVSGSIAAAVGLIFLGNMASVQPSANGKELHVHFALAPDAQDQSRDASERLKGYRSAQADLPADGRDWNHANDFWTSDVKALYAMTSASKAEDTTATMLGRAPSFAVEAERLGEQGGEDPKARAIRQAYEGQMERGNMVLAMKNATEGEKAVDEFRRQSTYDSSPEQSKGAETSGLGLLAFQAGQGKDKDVVSQRKLASAADRNGQKAVELSEAKSSEPSDPASDVVTNSLALRTTPTPVVSPGQGGGPTPTGAHFWLETGKLPGLATPPSPPAVQDTRKIIHTADVALEVESYDATYTKLAELASAEKGFVASANTQKLANGKVQATVVLRLPPDRFEAVIARLKDLGTIRHQNIGSEDVTKVYIDLESRLSSKQILAERLKKLLAEGKGTVKELMEVEVQLGSTNEAIESLKGEIKYYDNRIGLSTLTLEIAEKDLGQPFEYVQTLQANLALTVRDPDEAYVKVQKEIVDAGGQVVDSRMNRQSDGSSTGTIRGRVDAEKFQALREALKKLGVATNDTVNQQKTAHGGREGMPKVDAPLRKEQAVLDLTVSSPPIFVTRRLQLVVETGEVESAYQNSRKSVEGAGGKIVDGSLMGRGDRKVAVLKIQCDADNFSALRESLQTAGKIKTATVSSVLPTASADGGTALLRERAEIEFTLVSPPQLIADENGIGKSIRDTFANSWASLLWSVEKLFVGISLAGPWLLLLGVGLFAWRRARRKKAPLAP